MPEQKKTLKPCVLCPAVREEDKVFCIRCGNLNRMYRNTFLYSHEGRAVLKEMFFDMKLFSRDTASTPENMALRNQSAEMLIRLSNGEEGAIDGLIASLMDIADIPKPKEDEQDG